MGLFPLIMVGLAIFFIVKNSSNKPNSAKKTQTTSSTVKNTSEKETISSADHVKTNNSPILNPFANQKQDRINRDKGIAKKIFIYGGIACLVLLIVGIIFALNSNMGTLEKMEKVSYIALPIVIILAVIGIGSILQNVKTSGKNKAEQNKKKDDFYKPYFCDEYGYAHYPSDPNFMIELRRYSNYNAIYYNIKFKEYERNDYIVDAYGNTYRIFNESSVIIRDHRGNFCKIKLK